MILKEELNKDETSSGDSECEKGFKMVVNMDKPPRAAESRLTQVMSETTNIRNSNLGNLNIIPNKLSSECPESPAMQLWRQTKSS